MGTISRQHSGQLLISLHSTSVTYVNTGKLTIKIKSLITPESAEILEEKIRDVLRDWNIEATIEDSITGNPTMTADRDDE